MEGQKILIYGPAKTGKSTFVKKVNATEKNEINDPIESFPVIYVCNQKPDNIEQYNIIIQFTHNDVLFEKY
jgi:GTPase SAR1 family protein